ncbi:DUF6157 family protein [Microbispora corallina]|uniref:Uncharacterized protein n=1 Tax=Microbispora corallina TaxID=83302 RepID=A0ABQ4G1G6_9ACTN|nr:DUF6157 family protein [Microbispora corallina]GIH40928.1 hypothetical protein Mco01_39280 [Microbispora corallina]
MPDDLNYRSTLIAVADDCPVTASEVPRPRGGRATVAVLQYEMISAAPHGLTQEDVLFETWLRRRDDLPPDPPGLAEDRRWELREAFFSRSQACLRASPLPRRHGWGLLFDAAGRVALCPMESAEYRRLVAGAGGVRVLKAMRSRRT